MSYLALLSSAKRFIKLVGIFYPCLTLFASSAYSKPEFISQTQKKALKAEITPLIDVKFNMSKSSSTYDSMAAAPFFDSCLSPESGGTYSNSKGEVYLGCVVLKSHPLSLDVSVTSSMNHIGIKDTSPLLTFPETKKNHVNLTTFKERADYAIPVYFDERIKSLDLKGSYVGTVRVITNIQ